MNTVFIPMTPGSRSVLAFATAILLGSLLAFSEGEASARIRGHVALGHAPKWVLVSYTAEGAETKPGRGAPWISFKRRKLEGNSGVNRYGGSCTIGDDGSLRIGGLHSTEMAGSPDRMRLETDYISLLSKVTTWSFDGPSLVLSDGTEKNRLVFTAG